MAVAAATEAVAAAVLALLLRRAPKLGRHIRASSTSMGRSGVGHTGR